MTTRSIRPCWRPGAAPRDRAAALPGRDEYRAYLDRHAAGVARWTPADRPAPGTPGRVAGHGPRRAGRDNRVRHFAIAGRPDHGTRQCDRRDGLPAVALRFDAGSQQHDRDSRRPGRRVEEGASVVAALVLADRLCTRLSVSGEPRFALCGMGQCQECRVTIDGQPHRLACQAVCRAGMAIRHRRTGMNIVILGAGPAGLAAAAAASAHGAQVTLVDDKAAPAARSGAAGRRALDRPARAGAVACAAARRVPMCASCRARGWWPRPAPRSLLLETAQGPLQLQWQRAILCSGARELLLPFPGWTLPGVTGAGGDPGAGQGRHAAARQACRHRRQRAAAAGRGRYRAPPWRQVAAIAEHRPTRALAAFFGRLARPPGKARSRCACWPACAACLTCATPRSPRPSATPACAACRYSNQAAPNATIACDFLACGFGLVPALEGGALFGCASRAARWRSMQPGHQRDRCVGGGRIDRHRRRRQGAGRRAHRRAWRRPARRLRAPICARRRARTPLRPAGAQLCAGAGAARLCSRYHRVPLRGRARARTGRRMATGAAPSCKRAPAWGRARAGCAARPAIPVWLGGARCAAGVPGQRGLPGQRGEGQS
jgi:hypothetical protein